MIGWLFDKLLLLWKRLGIRVIRMWLRYGYFGYCRRHGHQRSYTRPTRCIKCNARLPGVNDERSP